MLDFWGVSFPSISEIPQLCSFARLRRPVSEVLGSRSCARTSFGKPGIEAVLGKDAAGTWLTLPETNSKRPWKLMVGILVSFWGGLFSGAMLVSGRVLLRLWSARLDLQKWFFDDQKSLGYYGTIIFEDGRKTSMGFLLWKTSILFFCWSLWKETRHFFFTFFFYYILSCPPFPVLANEALVPDLLA